jgi:hypothetical protein
MRAASTSFWAAELCQACAFSTLSNAIRIWASSQFFSLDADRAELSPNVSFGSWPCQNALMYGAQWSERGANPLSLSEFDYARIAAMSGWTPMMFMTRVLRGLIG